MKTKTLLIFIVLLLFNWLDTQAQLAPFPNEGAEYGNIYVCGFSSGCDYNNTSFKYDSDVTLCGMTYHRFIFMFENDFFVRTDNGKYYYTYSNCDNEQLLYDFSLEVGDLFESDLNGELIVDEVGVISLLNGEERKYLKLISTNPDNNTVLHWADGIGNIVGGFFTSYDFEGGGSSFVCYKDATGLLYEFDANIAPPSGTLSIVDCDFLLCDFPIVNMNSIPSDSNPLSFQFDNYTLNADTYIWDFGDGNTSTEENPSYTFASAGCYNVCLEANSECGQTETNCFSVDAATDNLWQAINSPTIADIKSCHFVSPNKGWVITTGQIFHTTDGGDNWEEQTYPPLPNNTAKLLTSIQFINDNVGIISTGNYLYTGHNPDSITNIIWTNDGGNTWAYKNWGNGNYLLSATLASETTAWGVGQYGNLFKTTDSGENWVDVNVPGGMSGSDIYAVNEDTVYFAGLDNFALSGAVVRTHNGLIWETTEFAFEESYRALDFVNGQLGWMVGYNGQIRKTADGGDTWQVQNAGLLYTINSVDFVDSQTGWAVVENGLILHTSDGGDNWIKQNCGDDTYLADVYFPSATVGYAVGNNGTILKYCPNIPMAAFSLEIDYENNSITTINESSYGEEFIWTFGNNEAQIIENTTYEYNQPSIYNVCLTVNNSCGTNVTCQWVDFLTDGIADDKWREEVRVNVYPNPSSSACTIELKEDALTAYPYQLKVYNTLGQLSYEDRINSGNLFHVQQQLVAKGLYFFTITNKQQNLVGSGKFSRR